MKKLILLGAVAFVIAAATPEKAVAQTGTGDYAGYLAALDTMNNADTATYEVTVTGKKHCVSFEIDITKISGTLGGTLNIYGSVNGTGYLTTPIASEVTITNASQNRGFVFTSNAYVKYKLVLITSGTQSSSHRPYVLYRKL